MILDHIEQMALPDPSRFSNEIQTLRSLAVGLGFLNHQVLAIENKVRESISPNVRVFSYGNEPRFAWVPKDLIVCAFHWYAVSARNYVGLVGWLAKQVCPARPEPADYAKAVIPVVVAYRHKVAAHFGKVFPRKDDTAATLDASVLPSVAFQDDSFYAGAWTVTKSVKGVPSSSPDLCWSLTKTHAELTKRYWPTEAEPTPPPT